MSNRAALESRIFDPKHHRLTVQTIKGLSMDAVQAANSGHPGMPMGAADMATVLWSRHLVVDPSRPDWPNRDRFILSAGHGSMLLYSLLHLGGFGLELDELRQFRQWGSRTPGHPEFGHTPGVELTTGPLGTGFASGVGLAIAERFLAQRYNRPGFQIVDHFTYAIVSDGDLMEGISAEAASLAGHLGLGKIVYLYDDNQITIDGQTDITFTEQVDQRFQAYGWHVERVDGHDTEAIHQAILRAKAETKRPSLICCRTRIADGSPNKVGTSASHGAPLGADEVAATKQGFGWPADRQFHVPEEVSAAFAGLQANWKQSRSSWEENLKSYAKEHPELAEEFARFVAGQLPGNVFQGLPDFQDGEKLATRDAGQKILKQLVLNHPTLLGGSADLAESNKVVIPESPGQSSKHPEGRNLHFGVREHAMAAICNGLAVHGGVRCFSATFLIFSDFMRGALRLSALMGLPVVHVLTHDSIWVGEDGPTHQPIEHTMSLRMIPGLYVVRPGDARETVGAWKMALERKHGPTAILLSRQKLPVLAGSQSNIEKGAYIAWEPPSVSDKKDAKGLLLAGIIIATGSELQLAFEAAEQLLKQGRRVRVVSMPCWEAFSEQSEDYREQILPSSVHRRVSVEAGTTLGWERFAEVQIGIDHFGASAPGAVLAEKFGFVSKSIVAHFLDA